MISFLLEPLAPKIENLNFVGHYGKLARVITRIIEKDIDTYIEESFPVSFLSDQDITLSNIYGDLVPNSSKKSIFFFEAPNPLKIKSERSNRGMIYKLETEVDLIGWLNLTKLNTNSPTVADYCIFELLKMLFYSIDLDGASISYQPVADLSSTINPFEKYSFDPNLVTIYPYASIMIRIQINAILSASCFNNIFPDGEISC